VARSGDRDTTVVPQEGMSSATLNLCSTSHVASSDAACIHERASVCTWGMPCARLIHIIFHKLPPTELSAREPFSRQAQEQAGRNR